MTLLKIFIAIDSPHRLKSSFSQSYSQSVENSLFQFSGRLCLGIKCTSHHHTDKNHFLIIIEGVHWYILKTRVIPKSNPKGSHRLRLQPLRKRHPQKRRIFYSVDKTQTILLLVLWNQDVSSFPEEFCSPVYQMSTLQSHASMHSHFHVW